jgi:hypothetical protein
MPSVTTLTRRSTRARYAQRGHWRTKLSPSLAHGAYVVEIDGRRVGTVWRQPDGRWSAQFHTGMKVINERTRRSAVGYLEALAS